MEDPPNLKAGTLGVLKKIIMSSSMVNFFMSLFLPDLISGPLASLLKALPLDQQVKGKLLEKNCLHKITLLMYNSYIKTIFFQQFSHCLLV